MNRFIWASLLAVSLTGSAMAQSNGSSSGGPGADGSVPVRGANDVSGGNNSGKDPNATQQPNGTNDRCQNAAGNDSSNSSAGGNPTDTQNCSK
jgi:hypothetical protein